MEKQQPVEEMETINTMPDELIFEILLWLPVKTLLRFRCVSKSWLSLISSSEFMKTHLEKSLNERDHNRHKLLFVSSRIFKNCPLNSALDASITEPSATIIDHPMRCNRGNLPCIVGSCNGLVCIKSPHNRLYLWNPATRKSIKLPKFGSKTVHCNWWYSLFCYGFGYDESKDDYKIIGISFVKISDAMGTEIRVKVYSLKTNLWRRIQDDFKVGGINEYGCFTNGKLHWVSDHIPGFDDARKIISFDLLNETFGEVEKPEQGMGPSDWSLHVFDGHLSLFCYYECRRVDVWVMENYGVKESWAKVRSIPSYSQPNGGEIFWNPVFLSKEGEVLFKYGQVIGLYNTEDNAYAFPRVTNLGDLSQVDVYVESLVSPNAVDGVHMHRA